MQYKDMHFYTTTKHLKYLIEVEKLSELEIVRVLRECWGHTDELGRYSGISNQEIQYLLDNYKENESD